MITTMTTTTNNIATAATLAARVTKVSVLLLKKNIQLFSKKCKALPCNIIVYTHNSKSNSKATVIHNSSNSSDSNTNQSNSSNSNNYNTTNLEL